MTEVKTDKKKVVETVKKEPDKAIKLLFISVQHDIEGYALGLEAYDGQHYFKYNLDTIMAYLQAFKKDTGYKDIFSQEIYDALGGTSWLKRWASGGFGKYDEIEITGSTLSLFYGQNASSMRMDFKPMLSGMQVSTMCLRVAGSGFMTLDRLELFSNAASDLVGSFKDKKRVNSVRSWNKKNMKMIYDKVVNGEGLKKD